MQIIPRDDANNIIYGLHFKDTFVALHTVTEDDFFFFFLNAAKFCSYLMEGRTVVQKHWSVSSSDDSKQYY